MGIRFPAFQAGVAGLSMNFGAYLAELFRAGIQSIDFGQREAARSLGLTAPQSLRHIILPQAIRVIFPALGNYALVLVKESSLVAVLSVHELMRAGELLASSTFQTMKYLHARGRDLPGDQLRAVPDLPRGREKAAAPRSGRPLRRVSRQRSATASRAGRS